MPAIFISYRREDSIAYSGRLYDRLTAEFGKGQVFMDIDSIDPGADFIEEIERTVAACDAVLVVIGRQWLTVVDAQGRRRLENPADFVRLEVETALSRKVRVVPVLVGGAQMPRSDELPATLEGLLRRHALDLPDTAFHQTLGRLIDSLRRNEAKALEQAEHECLARETDGRERSERDRLARDAKTQEQEELERLALDTKAREPGNQERLAREAKALEQVEQERLARAREQTEQDRIAHEAKAREQAERERLSIKTEARERVEQKRLAREAIPKRSEKERQPSRNDTIVPGRTADGSITQPLEQLPSGGETIPSIAPASGMRFPIWAVAALAGAALVGSGAVVYLRTHSRPATTQTGITTALREVQTKVNSKDGLTYMWIQPGTFTMGCSPNDFYCADNEKPAHQVNITTGFWMGQTSVTQQAYQRIVGKNPSHFKGEQLPVETVNWNEAQSYCQAAGMRLPTEAEWEYAARAGTTESTYGHIDQIAWSDDDPGGRHEVMQKQPNAWGLYDMLGNVWQWTADWYTDKYSGKSETDPHGPTSGEDRGMRGGADNIYPRNIRVSYRSEAAPEDRDSLVGFRCLGN